MTYGIDVSCYQGIIDWDRVKAAGVQWAIVRAGYVGKVDSQFHRNMSECNRLGIPVGVYYFSYALDTEDARRDARDCLALIGQYRLDLPVWYDFEYDTERYAKLCGVTYTPQTRTDIIMAFCSEVEAAGYYVGNYTNPDYLRNRLDGDRLTARFDLWLAQYTATPYRTCGIHQYGSTGRVDGIAGNVDVNNAYKDYPAIIAAWGLNHLPPAEPVVKTPAVGDSVTVRPNTPVNYMYETPVTVKAIKGSNAILAVGEQIVAVTATDNLVLNEMVTH